MAQVLKAVLLSLAVDAGLTVEKGTKKPDLIEALNNAGVEIPGMEPEEQGPIGPTKGGRFPGRKLEAVREVNGAVKIKQINGDTDGARDFNYNIFMAKPGQKQGVKVETSADFDSAKIRARELAIEHQLAFNVEKDYTPQG